MPMHRRRVYLERGSSRKARIEGWLSLSIYVSAAILMLSMLACLPDLISSTVRWLRPETANFRFGGAAPWTERVSTWTVICKGLMTLSGAYLVGALFIKSNDR